MERTRERNAPTASTTAATRARVNSSEGPEFGRSGEMAAFNCDFIGTTDLPKQYGPFRLYSFNAHPLALRTERAV